MKLSQLKKIFFNKGTRTFLYCLLSALVLWAVVYLNDTFRYTFSYPIKFTNTANSGIQILQSDNIVRVRVADNGFKMIYYSITEEKKGVTIDLDEFLPNKASGKYTFLFAKYKQLVLEKLKYTNTDVEFLTESIALTWEPLFSKKVKPVLDVNLLFDNQYGLYGEMDIYPKEVTITGTASSLKKINSVFTRKIDLKNLNTSSFHYIPLEKYTQYPDVAIPLPFIAAYLPVEKYTEIEVDIPITIPENLQGQIKIFPDRAQVICMVALKDYKKVTPQMFAATVEYDPTTHHAALPLRLEHFPDFVKNQRLKNDKVDYVIIKK